MWHRATEQGCWRRQLGGVGSGSLVAERQQLQGGNCGSKSMVAVQQWDGSGGSGGCGSLVKARRLQHFGGSVVAAASEW